MAAALKLPAVFVCLNNQWGITTHIYDVMAGGNIAKRADGYGIPGVQIDGQDVVKVYEAAREAVARARRGEGPTLIEAVTYRIGGHSSTSPDFDFMDLEVMGKFKARDPLAILRKRLLADGIASRQELDAIDRAVHEETEEAVGFALNEPFPAPEEAVRGVFV